MAHNSGMCWHIIGSIAFPEYFLLSTNKLPPGALKYVYRHVRSDQNAKRGGMNTVSLMQILLWIPRSPLTANSCLAGQKKFTFLFLFSCEYSILLDRINFTLCCHLLEVSCQAFITEIRYFSICESKGRDLKTLVCCDCLTSLVSTETSKFKHTATTVPVVYVCDDNQSNQRWW